MQPSTLREEDFRSYPPRGRALAVEHLPLLQKIPMALLPVILRQLIDYDWRFPVEQRALESKLHYLSTVSASSLKETMAPFADILLPESMTASNWVAHPQAFNEQLSAALWSMQQQDAYHVAAVRFERRLEEHLGDTPPLVPRFTVVALGQGVSQTKRPLFRHLRAHGVLFTAVQPAGGMPSLVQFVKERARSNPQSYGHWYIDGGTLEPACGKEQGVTSTSYRGLAQVTRKITDLTAHFVANADAKGSVSPTAVQSFIASLNEGETAFHNGDDDAVMRHFEIDILTGGAGAQVFSTTFVQWAAREAMRRAQPLTMFARFRPRQRFAPMNELLDRDASTQELDPEGSLIDAEMAAYYTWINQSRLAGAKEARFLAWHEGQALALAISPSMPQGTVSDKPTDLATILQWMS